MTIEVSNANGYFLVSNANGYFLPESQILNFPIQRSGPFEINFGIDWSMDFMGEAIAAAERLLTVFDP